MLNLMMIQHVTSIYLIRHAEKDRTESNNSNPHLNSLGQERSLRWKTFFKNIEFDEFYSTNYHRTIETIKPISKWSGDSNLQSINHKL